MTLELTELMRAEQRPDVYYGLTGNGRRPRWIADTRSGLDEIGDDGIAKLDCRLFPPGTTIIVSVPDCPECGIEAEPPEAGKVPSCSGCGFDWEAWAGDYFS